MAGSSQFVDGGQTLVSIEVRTSLLPANARLLGLQLSEVCKRYFSTHAESITFAYIRAIAEGVYQPVVFLREVPGQHNAIVVLSHNDAIRELMRLHPDDALTLRQGLPAGMFMVVIIAGDEVTAALISEPSMS